MVGPVASVDRSIEKYSLQSGSAMSVVREDDMETQEVGPSVLYV